MKRKNEIPQKLSYESDGKMGERKNTNPKEKSERLFFNSTQDSE